ncbi:MAG: LD-carboxypeptidase [Cyanobacteria bacterium HKST-UBA02]|nr:LD-carboxypeptidase [Cyanobacteria bacterium HKST-UBA02]
MTASKNNNNLPAGGAIKKPRALVPGDRVALLSPASRPKSVVDVARARALVEQMGFVPVTGEHALATHGYLAGSDADRLADLNAAIADSSVRAIIFLTGGYGSLRLLEKIDYRALAADPKIVLGGDETTCILLAMRKLAGLVTFYGANLDRVRSPGAIKELESVLTSSAVLSPLAGDRDVTASRFCFAPVAGEKVTGEITGGNLSALCSLMGTRYQVDTDDCIVALTDRNERYDILDRWFSNLYVSGRMERFAGIACGEFENCGPRDSRNLLSLEDMFADRLERLSLPSCFNLPFGEGPGCRILPLGIQASFDAGAGRIEFAEPALSTG